MSLNKKIQNIVIGLDTKLNQLKILRNFGSSHKKLTVEHLAYEPDLHQNNLFDLLDSLLAYHLSQNPGHMLDGFVVLPNHFVFTQLIELPLMPSSRLAAALNAEIARICPQNEDYASTVTQVSKTKTNVQFFVALVQQQVLDDCIKACKKNGINLRGISYSANCTINSFNALSGAKLQDFMFLDVQEKQSVLSYCTQGKTTTFFTLPIGQNFLSSTQKNVLANFKKNHYAQKEVFGAMGVNAYNVTFAGSTVSEIEKNAFQHFKNTFLNNQIAQEEFVFSQQPSQSQLSANFGVLVRYISAANQFAQLQGLPIPQTTVVNLPKNLSPALSGQASDVSLSLLKDHLTEKCLITDYLDLYGALFINTYNKTQNFQTKVKGKTQPKKASV